MANGRFFRAQGELAARFRLITPDLRGHGQSRSGIHPPTVERIVADMEELVDQLGLEGAIGVGWSLGATVLWNLLAGGQARRFRGAVVVDMTARVRNGAEWALGLSPEACEARSLAMREDFQGFATSAGQAIFAQPLDPGMKDLADWAGREFARCDSRAILVAWESLIAQDVRPLLGRIDHPTLIVHGAQSSLYGKDTADHLVAALPNAQAVRFEKSGHAPQLEQPDLFNATLREFADRLSCGRFPQTIES